MALTFFHMADIHLDQPFSSLGLQEGFPSKRREEIFHEFMRILETAREEQPSFIFISGDLYEHEYTNIKRISRINEAFSELKGNIILISGNHDPESKNSFYRSFPWSENVHVLGRSKPNVVFEKEKVCVFGIGYDTGGGQAKILETIRTDRKYINVLLLHGDVDLSLSTYNAVSSDMLKDIGFDYVALGHNHRMYVKDNIYNPGSLCALKFGEDGKHGYFKGDLSTGQVEFVESKARKYIDLKMDYEKFADFERMYPDRQDIYRIKVTGTKSDYQPLATPEGYDYVQLTDARTAEKKEKKQHVSQGIKGRFTDIMTTKMEEVLSEEIKIYEDALKLGLQALSDEELDLE
ncbi:MAG TPA: metallophosphoesterase [Clostridia bacterium]|nr:metallophosphoesterase [Clostridia bacterium]